MIDNMIIRMFVLITATTTTTTTTGASNSCSASCAQVFSGCHNHFKTNKGMTCSRAYTICRNDILDEGKLSGCKKKCKGTKKMIALKSCTSTTSTTSTTSCTTSCANEFKNCHNWLKGRLGCSRAYTACRDNLNRGNMARGGCKKNCKDTKTMTALKSCKKSG